MLYVGIDIGKTGHVAALISLDLLKRHERYDACPVMRVENQRAGFVSLLAAMQAHASTTTCHVLMEHTGHYGAALEQFLREHGVTVYRMQAKKRYATNKTDTRDARALAVLLYNQVELHTPIVDTKSRVVPLVAPESAAATLRGLVRHRHELKRECTQRKNKLTSLCDEMFPELTQAYVDPNTESALALREKFPTPTAVAQADIGELLATRLHHLPSREKMLALQELAATSIGTRDPARLRSLLIEQEQLIVELRLLSGHALRLDAEIEQIVTGSREGQILLSFPGIGAVQAATLASGIGSIGNFKNDDHLRSYLGWSPRQSQTGSTYDSARLDKSGNSLLKQTMYLVALSAIRHDPSWRALYLRLVERKCDYNARTKRHMGKMKVVGRIAGQFIGVLYLLLRKDYDLLVSLSPGMVAPPPQLYDPARHIVTIGNEKAGESTH